MTLKDDPTWVRKVTRQAEQALEAAREAAIPPGEDPDNLWNRFDAMETVADEIHELIELQRYTVTLSAWLQSRVDTGYSLLYTLIHEGDG